MHHLHESPQPADRFEGGRRQRQQDDAHAVWTYVPLRLSAELDERQDGVSDVQGAPATAGRRLGSQVASAMLDTTLPFSVCE